MEETDQCLPVAPLRDVLEQFREAMAPITSQEEFQKIEQDIESFFTGEGNFLQEKLKEYSKQLRGTSWLREYSQQRFLSLRTPLTIVGNFTLEFWKNGEETSLLRNGTALAWSVGRLYQQLQAGEVPVPQGSSLSVRSEQMERVLGSARLPGHGTIPTRYIQLMRYEPSVFFIGTATIGWSCLLRMESWQSPVRFMPVWQKFWGKNALRSG